MWIALCKYAKTYCERQTLLDVARRLIIYVLVNFLERALLKPRVPVVLHRHKSSK